MSRGRCLNVAAGVVSSFRWGTRLRPLPSAAADAEAFGRLAGARSFESVTLLNQQARLDDVRAAIAAAAATLTAGDTFVLTFNGHGLAGRTRGVAQQSWCLFDAPLMRFGEDGLDALLASFAPGVRIFVVSNCCHSGRPDEPTPPTPAIRAHVVRLSVCGIGGWAEAGEGAAVSRFASRVVAAASASTDFAAFFHAIDDGSAQLEIADPRSDAFLDAGPFRL